VAEAAFKHRQAITELFFWTALPCRLLPIAWPHYQATCCPPALSHEAPSRKHVKPPRTCESGLNKSGATPVQRGRAIVNLLCTPAGAADRGLQESKLRFWY